MRTTRTKTNTLNVWVCAQQAGPPTEIKTRSADSATRAALPVKIMVRQEMLRDVLNVHLLIRCCMQPIPSASQAVDWDIIKSIRTQRLGTVIATSASFLVLSARATNRTAHGASGVFHLLLQMIQNHHLKTMAIKHQLCL